MTETNKLRAGAAQEDISPKDSQFLYGYPHVERYSTGIHDKLLSSALYLSNPETNSDAMFIANDIVFISKEMTKYIRENISNRTGMHPEHIMVTATHTHSGPKTMNTTVEQADPAVPNADEHYVKFMLGQIIKAGIAAYRDARPAKLGMATVEVTGVGTNRRDPSGPSDPEVPVLLVRDLDNRNIACMQVCSMHPTVLHEDSTLVSGDFPGMARLYLQENVLGKHCPVLHHTGPAGNQSPRHVTRSNTFEEAIRLGDILGKSVESAIDGMEFSDAVRIDTCTSLIEDLPRQRFPSVQAAKQDLARAAERLSFLRQHNAPKAETRTAECDWFGAEKKLALATAAADGSIEASRAKCLPAEIQVIKIGKWNIVGWPGEIFVEYALEVKKQQPDTYVTAYSNGTLNGYIVTREAFEEGGYEASIAQFTWETGCLLVENTLPLVVQT